MTSINKRYKRKYFKGIKWENSRFGKRLRLKYALGIMQAAITLVMSRSNISEIRATQFGGQKTSKIIKKIAIAEATITTTKEVVQIINNAKPRTR